MTNLEIILTLGLIVFMILSVLGLQLILQLESIVKGLILDYDILKEKYNNTVKKHNQNVDAYNTLLKQQTETDKKGEKCKDEKNR